ncbi:MAG: DUF1549 domain-containing protein, partial [Planctomycetota bacterium]|nr:DUF1549 domain-containing protein [Planctomycetota bacterium]
MPGSRHVRPFVEIAYGIALGCAFCWFTFGPGSQSHVLADDETPRPADVEFFEQKVRPILVNRCYDCHGPDSGDGEGGLRLDARSSLIRGGNSGSALVPGKPDQSLIILAVQHDPSLAAMPPKAKLKPEEIQSLVRWVERGAEWPKDPQAIERTNVVSAIGAELSPESLAEARRFWAFVPPVEPDVPFLWTNSRPRSPVDVLIFGRLERAEITPAPEADRRTLIRRATFDLLGLPPDPDDV